MAVRRCLSGKITESDAFYVLPESAQALYLHLNMQADDDGFVNNASGIALHLPNGREALQELVEKRFLLKFGDVYVIKHWKIANALKNDRIRALQYEAIAQKVWVKGNRAYTDHPVADGITLYAMRTETDGYPTIWNPKRKEEKRSKKNRKEPKRTEAAGGDESWREILRLYPEDCIGNPEAAYEAYCEVVKDEKEKGQMLENLELWLRSEQWGKDNGTYIPYLENWILRGIWRGKPRRFAIPLGASGQLGEAELEAIRAVLAQKDEEIPDPIG